MKTLPRIVVIVGPTGSGKTACAISLAQAFNGEVISADSRQVYRGLDIGTEKATQAEMSDIPHHLIDICDIETVYTAPDFARDATVAIQEIHERDRIPIIAGGTFFYIDALLGKVSTASVPPNPELRASLEKESTESLYAKIQKLDPKRASTIDPNNQRRLVRALEIVEALGEVPTPTIIDPTFNSLTIGLEIDFSELRSRLEKRAHHALERGLIDETELLLKTGVSKTRLQEIGLEYSLVLDYLDNLITKEELTQKLVEKNWQYAKRQRTWLKRDSSIEWHQAGDTEAIKKTVVNFLWK